MNPNKFAFTAYPLGSLYIAAILEEDGHKVKLYDENFDTNMSIGGFDAVLFSCMTTMVDHALDLVDDVRDKDFDIPVIFGGAHATILPETLLRYPRDFAVIGEGELTIKEFIDSDFGPVPGMYGMQKRPYIQDLDSLPLPARHLLHTKYLTTHRANVVGSRGCTGNCTFCQPTLRMIFGSKLRLRSPRCIREEIEIERDEHGVRMAIFHDDTATLNHPWLKELCHEMSETDVEWECQARVDNVDYDILKLMRDSRCSNIRFGVEHGTQEVLDFYRKGIKLEQTIRAFDICNELGIPTQAYVMIGGPRDTRESVRATEKLVKRIRPTRLYVTVTTPMPKTQLWEDAVEQGTLVDAPWEHYNPSGQHSLLKLESLTQEEVVAARNKMLRRFWIPKLFSFRFVLDSLRTHSLREAFSTFSHLIGVK